MSAPCAYHNCENVSKDTTMFPFPVRNKDRLLLWIRNSGNNLLSSLSNVELRRRQICAKHFLPSDICHGFLRSRLIRRAVPIHYQSADVVEETLTQTCAVHKEIEIPSSSEIVKVEKLPQSYERSRTTAIKTTKMEPLQPSRDAFFMPINLREIKRELCDVTDETVKKELLSYNEIESDLTTPHVGNIKHENTEDVEAVPQDVNVNNERLIYKDDVKEGKKQIEVTIDDIDIEEMKLEPSQDGNGEHDSASAMKCERQAHVGTPYTCKRNAKTVQLHNHTKTLGVARNQAKINKGRSRSSVHGERSFECDKCLKTFTQKDYLERHLKVHSQKNYPFHCAMCPTKFRWRSCLISHLKIHSGVKPFECAVCGKRFFTKSNLKIHSRSHSKEKHFECAICGKRSGRKEHLINHLKTHSIEKPFKCEKCRKTFKYSKSLSIHSITHSLEKPFECERCQKTFKWKASLVHHLQTHTEEKPFKCMVCQKMFRWKGGLESHLKSHSGEKPFECEICRKRFSHRSNLAMHLKTHTEEKPFECGICGRRSSRKEHLKTHINTHSTEKPFECAICYKTFKVKRCFLTHVMGHTNEKRFQFEIGPATEN